MQEHSLIGLARARGRYEPPRRSSPATSRSVITARCVAGRLSIAPSITCRVSSREQPLLGPVAAGDQWPMRRGRSDPASTAGSELAPEDENGIVRPSRSARVFARLARMRKIQVLSDERPSKRSMPFEHGEPGLLHDLLGDRAARDVHLSHAQERALVHADELLEDALVARAQRRHEPHLLQLRAACSTPRL